MVKKTHKPSGLCLVHSGDGKGKTTSSVGLTVRGLAYGWNVLVVQFLKTDCAAYDLLAKTFPEQITLRQYGVQKITLPSNLNETDYALVNEAWEFINENYENYDLVVLDESLGSLNLGLYKRTTLWKLIDNCKEKKINLVLTGRLWSRDLLHKVVEKSSLFTECKPRKHYFYKHCTNCQREFRDHYDYVICPYCGQDLKSYGSHFGVEM